MNSTLEDAKTKLENDPDDDDQVEEDDDETEGGGGEPNADATGQTTAFDRSQYELEGLQIPGVYGETIDKIRIKFSGSVMLNRSDEADVALFNALRLGKQVELRCAGKVSGSSGGFTTSKDGDLDAVVGSKTLTVDTVWVLDPEDL